MPSVFLVVGALFFLLRSVAFCAVASDQPATGSSRNSADTIEDFIARELAKGHIPNWLIKEKSPYLLQHAFNPVDWMAWGDEAFERARKENKPIFLSIGYSTCHWCHVMAHESFESETVAEVLNKYFVCIKVDREERPDIDQVYMAFTQAMTGSGGWPMSVFLTPDLKPFYAGTYFPPESRYGRPGFVDLLGSIHQSWISDQQNIINSADQITSRLQTTIATRENVLPVERNAVFAKAYQQLSSSFDQQDGGFGSAPKFPRPVALDFLLRYAHREKDAKALAIVVTTMHKMAEGGIHDQLGGGFHRYSVDQRWLVPHFEKMLYDQAQLATTYLDGFLLTGDESLAETARDIFDYVLTEMTDQKGGFYSAEDADSPDPDNHMKKREGAYYVWRADEITQLLGPELAPVFNYRFGIESGGNVNDDPHREFTNKNILHLAHSIPEVSDHFKMDREKTEALLRQASDKVLTRRNNRPRPHLDDKIITAWNGLMISALAKGYRVIADPRYLAAATNAADFILNTLYDSKNKKLMRRYRGSEAGLNANLADFVCLIQGLLDLYEASFDRRWLREAIALNILQVENFEDKKAGGFYDTSESNENLLFRMKEDYDGAEPAANSIAVHNLSRLAWITGNDNWRKLGEKTVHAFGEVLQNSSFALPGMLLGLDNLTGKHRQIIIVGDRQDKLTGQMLGLINSAYHPELTVFLVASEEDRKYLAQFQPAISGFAQLNAKTTAYLCENFVCRLPTNDLTELHKLLEGN
ncbi:MAG: thioredoxin domain-containing protein [Proteobacteria bacterium]|nr:thioredoxin domain-containing protein [Pseudomonadota bacterium]